jgi:hypothetical protein
MLLAVAFALLKVQSLGPVLPPDCSPQFQKAFYDVEEALQSESFDQAAQLFRLLPKKDITVTWVDDKVPAAYREAYHKAGADALAMWTTRLKGAKFKFGAHGDIQVSFEPVLANRPGTNFPAARVGFFGIDSSAPRLDFVIGLKRGSPVQDTEEVDVFNDVAYGIGTYLGIADGISPDNVMGTTDLKRIARVTVSSTEHIAATKNILAVDNLEIAVKNRVAIRVAKPGLFVDPVEMEGEPAVQGDRVEFRVQISNNGLAPLSFSFAADCGCTAVTAPGTVEPQSNKIARFAVDTRAFSTNITKHVTIFTNDPVTPSKVITLHVKVKPFYRLIAPLGYSVVVPDEGLKYPIYLIPANDSSLVPIQTSFSGPGVNVKVSPVIGMKSPPAIWQGMLADPERNEGPMLRKGYKFVLDIKGKMLPGRNPCTFQIFTANPLFPDLTFSMYAQSGIVVEPAYLNLGQVGHVPVTGQLLISEPGKALKILSVTCTSPHVHSIVKPYDSPGEYLASFQFDGKSDPGTLVATIRIKTNDHKQPLIEIPFMATIR